MNIKPTGNPVLIKDQIYGRLVVMISNGTLTPGVIFTENQLVQQFQVSKSPVREALIQLCHEDVLKSLPRCGYQVVPVTAKNIHDIAELRMYLELDSIPHILETLTREKIQALEALRQTPAGAASQEEHFWNIWNKNMNFHLALVSCAENTQVIKELKRAFSVMSRAYAQLCPSQKLSLLSGSEDFYDKLLPALEEHDTYHTHKILKQDIAFMERLLLNINADYKANAGD